MSPSLVQVPTLNYLEAAATLQMVGLLRPHNFLYPFSPNLKNFQNNALSLPQQAFLSTEDPTALEELYSALEQPRFNRWVIYYSDLPRANTNGHDQLSRFGNLPRGRLTHLWLLQLLMALECDAWIGTRSSNWNRLIDELRCVWVPKCSLPFVEVGDPGLGI